MAVEDSKTILQALQMDLEVGVATLMALVRMELLGRVIKVEMQVAKLRAVAVAAQARLEQTLLAAIIPATGALEPLLQYLVVPLLMLVVAVVVVEDQVGVLLVQVVAD